MFPCYGQQRQSTGLGPGRPRRRAPGPRGPARLLRCDVHTRGSRPSRPATAKREQPRAPKAPGRPEGKARPACRENGAPAECGGARARGAHDWGASEVNETPARLQPQSRSAHASRLGHVGPFQTLSLVATAAILLLFVRLLVTETNCKAGGIGVFAENTDPPPPAPISFPLLEIRYFLFAVHRAEWCRSNVTLALNFKYLTVPSRLLKGKFAFRFYIYKGTYSLCLCLKKKKNQTEKLLKENGINWVTSHAHLSTPQPPAPRKRKCPTTKLFPLLNKTRYQRQEKEKALGSSQSAIETIPVWSQKRGAEVAEIALQVSIHILSVKKPGPRREAAR